MRLGGGKVAGGFDVVIVGGIVGLVGLIVGWILNAGGSGAGPGLAARPGDRAQGFTSGAPGAGATFATGGTRGPQDQGFFLEPTLVVGVDNSYEIARQEVFGPVLVALPYDTDDQAVEIANDPDFGLPGAG